EKISPQLAVRDAANSTVKAKQGTFTFSIVGAENDLNAVLNDGAKLSEEDRKGLHLLSQSHISLTTAPNVFALDVKLRDIAPADPVKGLAREVAGGGATGGAPAATTPASTPSASQFKQAKDAIGKALRDNTSIARQKGDSTGDHYVVTVNSLRGLYSAVLPVI